MYLLHDSVKIQPTMFDGNLYNDSFTLLYTYICIPNH